MTFHKIKDPIGGELFIDDDGKAYRADRSRAPEYDAPPSADYRPPSLKGRMLTACSKCGMAGYETSHPETVWCKCSRPELFEEYERSVECELCGARYGERDKPGAPCPKCGTPHNVVRSSYRPPGAATMDRAHVLATLARSHHDLTKLSEHSGYRPEVPQASVDYIAMRLGFTAGEWAEAKVRR